MYLGCRIIRKIPIVDDPFYQIRLVGDVKLIVALLGHFHYLRKLNLVVISLYKIMNILNAILFDQIICNDPIICFGFSVAENRFSELNIVRKYLDK